MFHKIFLICCLALTLDSYGPSQPAIIVSITFEGNQSLSSAQLKRQLRMVKEGNPYQAGSLSIDLKNLERFYRDSGFLYAKVDLPAVQFHPLEDGGQGAIIRVSVVEGSLYTLGNLEFKNARVLQVRTMLQMAPISRGMPYNRDKIYRWIGKITESYHSMGYIRFSVDLKEEVDDSRHLVDCSLDFSEGNVHRVGKIMVAGNHPIKMADFKRQLLVAEGSVYDPQMLYHSLEFLNMKRIYKPLTPRDVEVRIDDTDSTVDLTFRIVPLKKPS